jgi:sugar lactone lactonase YvrE
VRTSEERLFESTYFASGFTAYIEGPACDSRGNFYAVAFERRGTIGRVSPDGQAELWLELPPGSNGCGMVLGSGNVLFVADATGHHVFCVDITTRAVKVHAHGPDMNQPNDLAIRRDGTIYASDPDWSTSTGQLWRIRPDGDLTLLESDMGTTNGIEVAPDGSMLYVNESVQRRVWAFRLDADGDVHDKRLFISFPEFSLDGMRCDVDGNLYVTRHGGGIVAQVAPTGDVLREIRLESGLGCTNLVFGGPDGRTVYVTVGDDGHVERFRVDRPGRSWQLSADWSKGR